MLSQNNQENKTSIRYAMLCHIYEHYENSLFSFIAPFISTVFFPADEGRLGIYMALSAGFLMSPFGAAVFSWVGDRYGRRRALVYAISLSVAPMIIVAFLPGYEQVGILSPILLILSRVAQGVSIGGAFYATITLVTEVSAPKKRPLNTGILLSMGFVGSLLGTLLAAFFSLSSMPEGMWRMTFLIGGVFGIFIYIFRDRFQESKEWEKADKSENKVPILQALRDYTKNVWAVFLFGGSLLLPFYIMLTWLPGHMSTIFQLTPAFNLMVTSLLLALSGLSIIVFCWMASFLNLKYMMYSSAFAALISSFMLHRGLEIESYTLLLSTQIFVVIYTSFHGAAAFLIIQKLFPIQYKYSGFAVPFSIGKALLVMSSPFMAELILRRTGQASNISYLLILASLLIFTGTYVAQPLSDNREL